ncbi:metal-dependent hydrolase [Salinirubellus salinus]|uniref:Metal-dependent hydrolase n=1 Tax=Salinirubellus salinus TaxID=1364945 RepID=A0A9E7R2A5_9EURY|nr:metal-dependent hydrolase [Salinirubellus salinus]UWM54327.1 metal-dependent hydrolase [Salinirubellus salinus]
MWPWEHLAVGYLCLSIGVRALRERPPTGPEAIVLGAGTQFPDLVDKPLSWGLGVFPTGYAVGHSALVALPVGTLLLWGARRAGHPVAGGAFVLGYWSHLAGDVLNPLRAGYTPELGRVLWPLVEGDPYGSDIGLRRVLVYLARFPGDVATLDPSSPELLYLLVPLPAMLLWVADGAPGPGVLVRVVYPRRGTER